MNVSLEKLNDVEGKITVSVEEQDYASELTKKLKEIGRTHDFPGFRKGHVPYAQLVRRFGRDVKSDIINNEVYKAVINYIEENKLHILGEPLPVEVKEISMEGKDYTFEYEVGIAPEINVDLTAETLPYYEITVTDQMMSEQDTALRERFGAQVPGEEVDEKALVKGAIMELNADGTVKETEDAIQVVSGIVAPMYFTDKEESAKFIGRHVGDKVVFNPFKTCNGNVNELASMLQIDKERAEGLTADFELAISEIIVVRPAEHNEEFYTNVFGKDKVADEEQYNNELRAMIARQLAPNSDELFRYQAQKQLVEKFGNFELPAEFLKKWLVVRNEELTAENIDEEYNKLIPVFKWELIKGKIAEMLEIKVEEAELVNYAKMIAYRQFAQYGMTNLTEDIFEDYAKRILAKRETRSQIAEQVFDVKMFNAVKAKATVDNKTVTLDEFKTIAEEAQK